MIQQSQIFSDKCTPAELFMLQFKTWKLCFKCSFPVLKIVNNLSRMKNRTYNKVKK